ncbi:hypothetical protein ACUIJQ_03410 [Levilactobacillus hammesii]|uniref:Uncharacterized protein n=1 Tax=Levilactobacillus hammesii DSM 16381 TaxID=1423753 RepID=A0A0R1ULP0_9LACO|nr:hypothetical protein [Levilactobacillus hammesii]KRL94093.1 hypothetical protein FD28_GL000640 [Levilactobacillus hammesii DSM 16381]
MQALKDGNGKIKRGWLIGGGIVLVAVIIIVAVMMMPKHLSGKYSHTSTFLLSKSTDTLKFDGDKVTEYSDGEKIHTGTYTLKKDDLDMKISGYHMHATLADDKKSFVINSADGLANLASGYKYSQSSN